MFTFLVSIHAIICILLVTVVLMQAGRGGGLTENFSSAESVFGAQTSSVMIKITSILGTLFILSSLNLTFQSLRKDKSLMESVPEVIEKNLPSFNSEMSGAVKESPTVTVPQKAMDVGNTSGVTTNSIQ